MQSIYRRVFFTLPLIIALVLFLFFSFTSALASTPFSDDWDGSMLYFDPFFGCESSCTQIMAKICNRRNVEPMQGTSEFQLYYNQDGDPQSGVILYSGTVAQLGPNECQTITYDPQNRGGSYRFVAKQRPGFPGEPLVKSDICKVNQCSSSDPSPTPAASTSPLPNPSPTPAETPATSPSPNPSPTQQPSPSPDPTNEPEDSNDDDDNGGTGGGGSSSGNNSSGGDNTSTSNTGGQVAGVTHLAATGNQETYALVGLIAGSGLLCKSCYDLYRQLQQKL